MVQGYSLWVFKIDLPTFNTLTYLFCVIGLGGVFGVEEFLLPPQRNTGLGCIREGEVVNYTCTVVDTSGISATRWTGVICPGQSSFFFLAHDQYYTSMGALQMCNNGEFVAQSIGPGVSGNDYTSVLTVNASRDLDEQTLSCSLVGAPAAVGSDTVQVGVVPGPPEPPVDPVCRFSGGTSTFFLTWRSPSGGVVGGAMYSVNVAGDNCGTCSDELMTSCSGWTPNGQTCTVTAQTITTDCGFTSVASQAVPVTLRVPPQPSVTMKPTYSQDGVLTNIGTDIPESQFANAGEVCSGVPGEVTHFVLEYVSSSGASCATNQVPDGCDGGVCRDMFDVTSECPGESYSVSVHAVNVVGMGPNTQDTFSFYNPLLNVSVDVKKRNLTCQFDEVGSISCSIRYRDDIGCVSESNTEMNSSPSGSVLFLALPENLVVGLYCYTVTASNGVSSVEIQGQIRIGPCEERGPPENGMISYDDNSLSPGTAATYTCNQGYRLVGDGIELCQTDGMWSGDPPVCYCTVTRQPLSSVNMGTLSSVDCVTAQYSVKTGFCPSSFTATFDFISEEWQYPSTSACIAVGTAVGITFVLTFIFTLALGVIIGVISVLLWKRFGRSRRKTTRQSHREDVQLRDTTTTAIYEDPDVISKQPEDIVTGGNIAYGPVNARR